MNARNTVLAIVVLVAATLAGMPCLAGDALQVIPETAWAVVVVNHIDQTQAKIVDFGKKSQLPAAAALQALPLKLDSQPHVDGEGDLAMAVVPHSEHGGPVPIWFVPTTDFAALVAQFEPKKPKAKLVQITVGGKQLVAARKAGYAVVAAAEDRKTLRAALRAKNHAADSVAALREWCGEQDVYAIALPGGIKFAQQNILAGLAAGKAQLAAAGEQGEMALAGIEMYEVLFGALDREISHHAIGLQLQDDGAVHVLGHTLLAKGGKLAEIAGDIEPFDGNLLAGLPAEEFVFAGGGVMPQALAEAMMDLSLGMIKMYPGGDKLTDDDVRKLAELSLDSMKGMRSMAMMLGTGEADEPLYGNMLLAIQVDDSEAYLKNYEKSISAMIELGKRTENPLFTSYRFERMRFGDKPGLKLTMNMDVYLGADQPPEAKRAMEAMFGKSDELDIFMTVADAHTIVGAYVSQQRLEAAIKAIGQPQQQLQHDETIKKTAQVFPEGAHVVGFWSPAGTTQFFGRLMGQMAPEAAVPLPDLTGSSPVGFAAKLSPTGVEYGMIIPADTVQAVANAVQSMAAPPQ